MSAQLQSHVGMDGSVPLLALGTDPTVLPEQGHAHVASRQIPFDYSVPAREPVAAVHPVHDSIDDITSWSHTCNLLALYTRYQHPMMPLVHKPTFSQDVLSRKDKRSESFKGLLCSLGEAFLGHG
jgi:hypothetical protein